MNIKKKICDIFLVLVVFIISSIFCHFINSNINIRSLYMDDLANYYYYLRQDFVTFSFGVIEGQQHFRPIFYSLLYLICALISTHISRIMIINVIINSIVATTVYICATKLNINKIFAMICAYLYLLSHFSYFQMGQMIGAIESEALFFSIILLTLSINYVLCEEKNKIYYIIAIVIDYYLLSMAHERYILNIFVILTAIILRFIIDKKNALLFFFGAILECILVFLIRYIALGTIVPVGTSSSDVLSTFSFPQALSYAISQVIYIFGINDGPEYLAGINFNNCTFSIKLLTYISIILLLTLILIYFIEKIKLLYSTSENRKIEGKDIAKYFSIDILIIIYIAICIGASSVTIRLEMRWIYASFTASMIYLVYMIQFLCKYFRLKMKNKRGLSLGCALTIIIFLAFLTLRTNTELYYRSFYDNIFFLHDLKITNDLADKTVYKYGKDIMNKKVYIIDNYFELSGKCEYYFYEPFFGEIYDGDDKVLNFIRDIDPASVETAELISNENNIVLVEDYGNLGYLVVPSK